MIDESDWSRQDLGVDNSEWHAIAPDSSVGEGLARETILVLRKVS